MTRLERAANVATIVAALVVCTYFGVRLTTKAEVASPPAQRPAFTRGDRFPTTLGVAFGGGQSIRLFVAVREGCRFCEASTEFYRRLATRVSGTGVSLVGVCPSSSEACAEYFEKRSIPVGMAIGDEIGNLRIRGTPTLVLVSGDGKVLDTWEGQLPADKEEAVLSTVAGK